MKQISIIVLLLVLIAPPLVVATAGEPLATAETDVRALGPQPEPPDMPAAVSERTFKFSLIRIAPFSGTNPFDYQSVRSDVTSARSASGGGSNDNGEEPGPTPINTCTPGTLILTTNTPFIPPAEAYIDINPASNLISFRDSGAAGTDTALIVSIPTIDLTRFSSGPGWQAISPALPQTYPAGAPPQTFVLRRSDSGDYYRLTISFIGTSTLVITNASGDCCGAGGCP